MSTLPPPGASTAKEEIAGVKKKRGCGATVNFVLFLVLAAWLIANALQPVPSVTSTTPTVTRRVTSVPAQPTGALPAATKPMLVPLATPTPRGTLR